MTSPRPASARPASRDPSRRAARDVGQAAALVLLPVAAVGWLLASPGELAAVRLAGVALAWWAAGAAGAVALLGLARAPRRGPSGRDGP